MSALKQFIKKFIFIIIPVIIVGLAALVILKSLLTPSPPQVMPQARVTVFEVKSVEVKNSWEVIGQLDASQRVDLVARVSGFLEKKAFEPGVPVSEGDALFLIEPKQYEAALQAAEGNLQSAQAQQDQAQISFDRTAGLYATKSVPKRDYDNAKANLDVAKAARTSAAALLEQAKLNLEYAVIKAPFDGKVSDSPFSEGAYIGPSSEILATIVKTDPLEVTLGIPDHLMADLRFGAETSPLPQGRVDTLVAKLKINGVHLYEEEGRVSYISPLVDRDTATIKVKATFANPEGILVPGETATVVLQDALPRAAILVPKNSVMQSPQGSFVYVAAPHPESGGLVAERRSVKRGQEFPQGLELIEGLAVGDKVVDLGLMAGGAMLRPGTPLVLVDNYEPIGGADEQDTSLQGLGEEPDPGPGQDSNAASEPQAEAQ
jgi:membrane fusion protein (multidrug efflux system)